MNFIKKSGWILCGSIILAIYLGTGCSKITKSNNNEKVIENFCKELFTFPSENNIKVLDAMENPVGVTIVGMGTEDIEKPKEDNCYVVLNKVYGKYLTEAELENFYNERVWIDILFAVRNQGYEMKFETIKKIKSSTEKDNTEKYLIEVVIDENHVEEEILVSFENEEISYISLIDNKIQETIQ